MVRRKPLVIVTRKLPEVIETRMMELFDTRLNESDAPWEKPRLIEAVKAAGIADHTTFVVTAASCYSGFLNVVSDDIPINSGCYRPIRLVTRPGTLVNVRHPGPSVGGNTETHPHIQNVVIRALAGVVPERVAAGEFDDQWRAWYDGSPAPFLAGETVSTVALQPAPRDETYKVTRSIDGGS